MTPIRFLIEAMRIRHAKTSNGLRVWCCGTFVRSPVSGYSREPIDCVLALDPNDAIKVMAEALNCYEDEIPDASIWRMDLKPWRYWMDRYPTVMAGNDPPPRFLETLYE